MLEASCAPRDVCAFARGGDDELNEIGRASAFSLVVGICSGRAWGQRQTTAFWGLFGRGDASVPFPTGRQRAGKKRAATVCDRRGHQRDERAPAGTRRNRSGHQRGERGTPQRSETSGTSGKNEAAPAARAGNPKRDGWPRRTEARKGANDAQGRTRPIFAARPR